MWRLDRWPASILSHTPRRNHLLSPEGAARVSAIRAFPGSSSAPYTAPTPFYPPPVDNSAREAAQRAAQEAVAKAKAEASERAAEKARLAAREEVARAERQREEAEREAAAIRRKLEEEARMKRDEEVAEYAQAKGYRLINFDDFTLDKKELVNSGGRSYYGYFMSRRAVRRPSYRRSVVTRPTILSRSSRRKPLATLARCFSCRKTKRKGFPYMVLGKVTPCIRKTDEKQFACLTVEDAREYGKPEESRNRKFPRTAGGAPVRSGCVQRRKRPPSKGGGERRRAFACPVVPIVEPPADGHSIMEPEPPERGIQNSQFE